MALCERCFKETVTTTMSMFNTDTCCMDCIDVEKMHPDYDKAKKIELDYIRKKDYTFQGIGLPEDYDDFIKQLK